MTFRKLLPVAAAALLLGRCTQPTPTVVTPPPPPPTTLPTPAPSRMPTVALLPSLQPRPEFIVGVSPEEGITVPLERYEYLGIERAVGLHVFELGYDTTVCVAFVLSPLVQSGDNLVETPLIEERCELILDSRDMGEVVSGLVRGPLGESPWDSPDTFWSERQVYCWHVPLDVGVHVAQFRFRQTSGDIQQYSWQFAITD